MLTFRRFAIVSPGGGGKTRHINMLLESFPWLKVAQSATTRTKRITENGHEYLFLTEKEFLQKKEQEFFVETNFHFDTWYGTPKTECSVADSAVIFDVDIDGAEKLKDIFPDLIIIYIKPPNRKTAKQRLEKRSDTSLEYIAKKMKRYAYENEKSTKLANEIFVNDDFKLCFSFLAGYIAFECGVEVTIGDGFSGSGKGTLFKNLAELRGAIYFDSGKCYRGIAYAYESILMLKPEDNYIDHINSAIKLVLNGINEDLLRTPEVDRIVANWAKLKPIREAVFKIQMAMLGQGEKLCFEGRDMCLLYRYAQFKFFVDCSVEERARRRSLSQGANYETVLENLKNRDWLDMTRDHNPVKYRAWLGVKKIDNNGPLEKTKQQLMSFFN